MKPQMARPLAISLVLLGASSYGMLSPVVKIAYEYGWNEMQVSTAQLLMGAFILWLMILVRPKTWKNPFRGPWIALSLTGIVGLALTAIFLNAAIKVLNASMAVVLLFQFTWISMVMESILNQQKPRLFQWIAVIFILSGTVLAVGLSAALFQGLNFQGILYGLLSAITYSFFIVFIGRIQTDMDSIMKSGVMLTASLPVAIPIMFFLFPGQAQVLSGDLVPLLGWGIILGLLGTVLPTIFFNLGIPQIGGGLAAMLGAMELPVAVVGAYFLLDEQILWVQWLGILLILIGMLVSELQTNTKKMNQSKLGE